MSSLKSNSDLWSKRRKIAFNHLFRSESLLLTILEFLNPRIDIPKIALLCKAFWQALSENDNLWNYFIFRDIGVKTIEKPHIKGVKISNLYYDEFGWWPRRIPRALKALHQSDGNNHAAPMDDITTSFSGNMFRSNLGKQTTKCASYKACIEGSNFLNEIDSVDSVNVSIDVKSLLNDGVNIMDHRFSDDGKLFVCTEKYGESPNSYCQLMVMDFYKEGWVKSSTSFESSTFGFNCMEHKNNDLYLGTNKASIVVLPHSILETDSDINIDMSDNNAFNPVTSSSLTNRVAIIKPTKYTDAELTEYCTLAGTSYDFCHQNQEINDMRCIESNQMVCVETAGRHPASLTTIDLITGKGSRRMPSKTSGSWIHAISTLANPFDRSNPSPVLCAVGECCASGRFHMLMLDMRLDDPVVSSTVMGRRMLWPLRSDERRGVVSVLNQGIEWSSGYLREVDFRKSTEVYASHRFASQTIHDFQLMPNDKGSILALASDIEVDNTKKFSQSVKLWSVNTTDMSDEPALVTTIDGKILPQTEGMNLRLLSFHPIFGAAISINSSVCHALPRVDF